MEANFCQIIINFLSRINKWRGKTSYVFFYVQHFVWFWEKRDAASSYFFKLMVTYFPWHACYLNWPSTCKPTSKHETLPHHGMEACQYLFGITWFHTICQHLQHGSPQCMPTPHWHARFNLLLKCYQQTIYFQQWEHRNHIKKSS